MTGFFKDIRTVERMKNGPLGCHITAYAEKLHAQGFSWQSGRRKLQLAADFSRWLKRNGVVASQVRAKHVGKYLQFRKRSGFGIQLGDPPAVTGFLNFLRDQGVTKERLSKPIITPCQRWLREYDGYLQKERAFSPATRINYGPFVRRFLVSRFGRGKVEFSKLRAPDVLKFVRRQAGQLKTKRVLLMVSALRSFLRFLRFRGEIKLDLAACVPAVASWSLSTIPRSLPPTQVKQVLARTRKRATGVGRCDYAILLLLAGLGLRGG